MNSQQEYEDQSALFTWARMLTPQEPRLRWLHSSLNGIRLSRHTANKAKRSGMTKGVWDVFLPVPSPSGTSAGLYDEMKAPTTLTPEQRAFRSDLEGTFAFTVCRQWADAARDICDYLERPDLAAALPPRSRPRRVPLAALGMVVSVKVTTEGSEPSVDHGGDPDKEPSITDAIPPS